MIYRCESQEYFAYNSLLTQHGTRVRRLRRTEVTAEKLACARIRSPDISSQKYILRDNRSSETQFYNNNSRSKVSFRYATGHRLNYGREKEDSSRQEISRANPHAMQSQNGSLYGAEVQSRRSVKDSVAQYYLKTSTAQHLAIKPKRSLRRLQSHQSSTHSIRQTQNKNQFKPLQQSEYLSKTSNLPYIPRCINKQILQKYTVEAAKPDIEPAQVSAKSSIYDEIESRKVSKKMSNINGSVVSRSSCLSRSAAKDENLSIQDNYRANRNESEVNEYSQMASDYGLECSSAKNIKPFPQIVAFYSKKELKSPQPINSKQSSKQVSKLSQSSQKMMRQPQHKPNINSVSKLSQTQAKYQVQRVPNDKLQKCYLTKKSTSADQSYKSNQTDNNLVFEFNRNSKEADNRRTIDTIAMSDTKGLKNGNQKNYVMTSQKEKRTVKFNPSIQTDTFQNITTPQNNAHTSRLSQQQLTSSIKSDKQKQSTPSLHKSKLSTVSNIVRQVEQHQMRLGFIYLFIDNTQQTYKGAIQFERYERLCFLMFKKYLYEMTRVVQALRGGPNCFILSGIQIRPEVLYKNVNSSLFSEKINDCVDETLQLTKKLEIEWHRISKKYTKDKLIKLQYTKDNFTKQIVKLLMQELTKLYQQLQSEQMQHQQVEDTQKRITEIIQIMFLLSELTGRKVKNFELLSQQKIDFNDYYALHYQKIIETHQFFQKLSE